jgi:hypothetical protein
MPVTAGVGCFHACTASCRPRTRSTTARSRRVRSRAGGAATRHQERRRTGDREGMRMWEDRNHRGLLKPRAHATSSLNLALGSGYSIGQEVLRPGATDGYPEHARDLRGVPTGRSDPPAEIAVSVFRPEPGVPAGILAGVISWTAFARMRDRRRGIGGWGWRRRRPELASSSMEITAVYSRSPSDRRGSMTEKSPATRRL